MEIFNGRTAMLATIGFVVQEYFTGDGHFPVLCIISFNKIVDVALSFVSVYVFRITCGDPNSRVFRYILVRSRRTAIDQIPNFVVMFSMPLSGNPCLPADSAFDGQGEEQSCVGLSTARRVLLIRFFGQPYSLATSWIFGFLGG